MMTEITVTAETMDEVKDISGRVGETMLEAGYHLLSATSRKEGERRIVSMRFHTSA